MTSKPPREGARWGEDPAPTVAEFPKPAGPPAKYVELCERFGEANVEKALSIFSKVKGEYPHLPILENGDLFFAEHALLSAKVTIEVAARDGRSHTMPETLKIIEGQIGGYLVQNSQFLGFATFQWNYGDEQSGNAAKKEQQKRDETAVGWILAISAILGISSFIVTLSEGSGFFGSLGIGAFIALGTFGGLAYLYDNS